jgi:predicted negative regulator of RcsB-dependent stress response
MQPDAAHSDNYVRFLAWAQANQKRLILWGTILVLAIAGVFFFIHYQGQKELRASVALSNVPVPLSPGATVPPGTADAYLKVATEHAGTKAGARALLLGAATFFTDGKYADAQKTFEQFLKQYPESQWVPQAHFGIASSLDAQGKTTEAISKYEEIRRRFANEPIIDEVKLAVARAYEPTKPEEAHKIYSELVQNNPYSGMGSEAGVRKAELEEKFPRLAPTNPPVMTPPTLTPPPLTSLTNRPAPTNRVITISNVTPRTATNTAVKQPTNAPLLIQPSASPGAPAAPAAPKQ